MTEKRGGKRAHAGRPGKGMVRITIRVTTQQQAKLSKLPNYNAVIRDLIEKL